MIKSFRFDDFLPHVGCTSEFMTGKSQFWGQSRALRAPDLRRTKASGPGACWATGKQGGFSKGTSGFDLEKMGRCRGCKENTRSRSKDTKRNQTNHGIGIPGAFRRKLSNTPASRPLWSWGNGRREGIQLATLNAGEGKGNGGHIRPYFTILSIEQVIQPLGFCGDKGHLGALGDIGLRGTWGNWLGYLPHYWIKSFGLLGFDWALGTLVSGDLGTLVGHLPHHWISHSTFSDLIWGQGTCGWTWRHWLGGGLGGHWLGAPATFGFMVPISLRRFELKLFIKLKTILTLLVKLEN